MRPFLSTTTPEMSVRWPSSPSNTAELGEEAKYGSVPGEGGALRWNGGR